MRSILRNLALGAAALMVIGALAGAPNVAAYAQTAAPSASTLPEATVKALQEALNKQGIAVKADGILSDATRAAIRQYQSQHHLPVTGEPDKATLDKLGVGAPTTSGQQTGAPTMGVAGSAGGMGATGGMAMPPGGTGMGMGMAAGTMGMGRMPMMGGMPMAGGMPMCPMMGGMMGMSPMMGGMMGMSPTMATPTAPMTGALIYGMPAAGAAEITLDQAKVMVEQLLAAHGNPRLKLGLARATEYGEFLAEIVTRDGSLVQRLAVDRRTGALRQVD